LIHGACGLVARFRSTAAQSNEINDLHVSLRLSMVQRGKSRVAQVKAEIWG
jgi:hypothetical protein